MMLFQTDVADRAASRVNLDEIADYIASAEFLEAVTAPGFEARCSEFFERVCAGEMMTLEEAETLIGLRWDLIGVALLNIAPDLLHLPPMTERVH